MEKIAETYRALGAGSATIDAARSLSIVAAAKPFALAALAGLEHPPSALQVTTRLVEPRLARGGLLVPAWPFRQEDGSVVIEFVADWGVLLAAWRCVVSEPDEARPLIDDLVASGDRLWTGIANDVMQLYVPDPPAETYSMVRHHALMLACATLWLGTERARLWHQAHTYAARAFLRGLDGRPLWQAVAQAEKALDDLLADRRARGSPEAALEWLATDREAAAAYQAYLSAGSLGIAALLDTVPAGQATEWQRSQIGDGHPRPEFNRAEIEAFAHRQGAPCGPG
jgi:hypothetical protein